MNCYMDIDGTGFTDDDIERWAAESEQGYRGGHFGPSVAGRPISAGQRATLDPLSRVLDAGLDLARAEARGCQLDADERAVVDLCDDIGGVRGIAADEREHR